MADTAWHDDVLRLKAEGKQSAEIAEIVGKHAATVRKVIARARDEAETPDPLARQEPEVEPDGDRIKVDVISGGKVVGMGTAKFNGSGYPIAETFEPIEGQTTVDDHLAAFKAEAGEAVGPMPPGEPEDTDPDVETRLSGTRQMALDFGENADIPVGGTLVIRSDKLASGFFGLGDVISGTFTARIVSVGGKEKFDKEFEEFRGEPVQHVALITDVAVSAD